MATQHDTTIGDKKVVTGLRDALAEMADQRDALRDECDRLKRLLDQRGKDHDYQWHPMSEDFGVCSECGAEASPEDVPVGSSTSLCCWEPCTNGAVTQRQTSDGRDIPVCAAHAHDSASLAVERLRECIGRLVTAVEGQEVCFCCGEGLTADEPQRGHVTECDYARVRDSIEDTTP